MKYYHIKASEVKLTYKEKWCDSCLVTFPVSYEYNGGIVLDKDGCMTFDEGTWYKGYKVPSPKVPKGFKLRSIACGLQLNAHPPYATMYLEPLDGRKVSAKELKTILAKQ